MNTLGLGEWLAHTEKCISTAVCRCSPRAWNEDHISYAWISALTAGLQEVTVQTDHPSPFSVAWDAYKADGALEEEQGDIAFLVRCSFSAGNAVTGVAFLEAKRAYPSGGDYQAMQRPQLEYQSSRIANHKLLLYDDTPIAGAADNLLLQGYCQACFPEPYRAVHAAVVPTPHALALHKRNRDLHALSTPLSYQICCRYLRGLDLDWEPSLVEAVRAGAVGGIRYLFVAHAVIGGEAIPSPNALEVNTNRYRHLTTDERPRNER